MTLQNGTKRLPKRYNVSKGISLRPVDVLALDYLEVEDRRHRSAVVQVLIDEEMRRRVGRDWEDQLLAEEHGHAERDREAVGV